MELIFINKFMKISNKYLHNKFNNIDIEIYPVFSILLSSYAFNAEFKIVRLYDISISSHIWEFSWTVIPLNKNNYRTIGNMGEILTLDSSKKCLDILMKDLPILILQYPNNAITVKCESGYSRLHILTDEFADDCLDLIDHWPFDI